jgi:hypothetical protein
MNAAWDTDCAFQWSLPSLLCEGAVTKCELLQVFAAWPVEACADNGLLVDALDGTSTAAALSCMMMRKTTIIFALHCDVANCRSSCVRAFW